MIMIIIRKPKIVYVIIKAPILEKGRNAPNPTYQVRLSSKEDQWMEFRLLA